MYIHKHPYPPYIHENTEKLIVGTLPPPRFSVGELLEKDVDFCYGSAHNSLWRYIDKIYRLGLRYDNSAEAVEQRKRFLSEQRIGVFDIVERCKRKDMTASDLGMTNVVLRDLISALHRYTDVHTLLFIGGNSKNGPEYFFRRHAKSKGISLNTVTTTSPRINRFSIQGRVIETVSLTSSSGAANISIGSNPEFKRKKAENPDYTPFDFRIEQYKAFL
ncbi:MAG: uracil-DNA glycosylase family protein [Flavobacteriaceae bacterium]|nr:uracil-DNA glycosylase family protein [Flavobacteriaceae bacterium]